MKVLECLMVTVKVFGTCWPIVVLCRKQIFWVAFIIRHVGCNHFFHTAHVLPQWTVFNIYPHSFTPSQTHCRTETIWFRYYCGFANTVTSLNYTDNLNDFKGIWNFFYLELWNRASPSCIYGICKYSCYYV